MKSSSPAVATLQTVSALYTRVLRAVVIAFAAVSGLAVMAMMAVTTFDVLYRVSGHTIHGAYDLVRIAGAIAIACALPYTTAVKGHVAIEYFYHKMNRPGRTVVDTLCRAMVIGLLGVFTWQCWNYGDTLKRTGEVSLTLQIPIFWVAYVIAVACGVTLLVTIHNLMHPGREMIKP